MPKKHHPRRGSLAVRPRKRANSQNVRVRSWPTVSENKVLGFAGYKAGMTHILMKDTRPGIPEKNATLSIPVTIIECPPLKVIGMRGYKKDIYGLFCSTQKFIENLAKIDKHLSKTLILPKKSPKPNDFKDLDEIRILVCTQPSKTNIGKKKPEVFEVALGGKIEEQLTLAESLLGKDIKASDVFKEGDELDTSSVTKGKGFQGPVKRHGVKIRFHKSEKTKRGPGSLGPWHGPRMWKVPHAGQMGYHQRSEYNKQVFMISDKSDIINPKGGFVNYGIVKNDFIMLKGSVGGPKKRLIKLLFPMRGNKKPFKLSKIEFISQESQQ